MDRSIDRSNNHRDRSNNHRDRIDRLCENRVRDRWNRNSIDVHVWLRTWMESKRRKLNDAATTATIADCVFALFRKLPKKGKPQEREYTTLAAIVATSGVDVRVISLATGTKCLPHCWTSPQRINDAHAEVLAKRAAVDYVLREAEYLSHNIHYPSQGHIRNDTLLFCPIEKGNIKLKSDVSFHLVVTEPPCGDAAIVMREDTEPVLRTGAKPIHYETGVVPEASDVESGQPQLGVLRRKPGKGEATMSMSCSDKILRWSFLGFQGRQMLSLLSRPLYLSSIIVCGADIPYAQHLRASMQRAFVERAKHLANRVQSPFEWRPPRIAIANPPPADLCLRSDATHKERSNTCINWTRSLTESVTPGRQKERSVCGGVHEVTLGNSGIRLGSPKFSKKPHTSIPHTFQSRLSREQLSIRCQSLRDAAISQEYQSQWAALQSSPSLFANWLSSSCDVTFLTSPQ